MLFEEEVQKIGYLSRSVPDGIDLKAAINELKVQKKAVILAHYYVADEIQAIADFVGDSFALAQYSQKVKAEMIVFCGVHFMAETAKILNPNSKVVLPDLKAGCSLADAAPEAAFRKFKLQHPNAVVVSYINCTAAVKSMSDYICTSSNAVEVVKAIPADKEIIFAPDGNLGRYVEKMTGRKLHIWDGACIVHVNISEEKLVKLMQLRPEAELIAHPECPATILDKATYIGSTKALIDYVQKSERQSFIVATEAGILYKMREAAPGKLIFPAPAFENNTCACSECPYMKMNTLEKVFNAMYYELPEITIAPEVQAGALNALNNMLAIK
jgi:quinolinate synthase